MDDFSLSNALMLLRALGEPEEEKNEMALEEEYSAFAAAYEETVETNFYESYLRRRSITSSQTLDVDSGNKVSDIEEEKSPQQFNNTRLYIPSAKTEGERTTDTVVSSNLRDIQPLKALALSGAETLLKSFSVSTSTKTTVENENIRSSRDSGNSALFACPPSTSSKTIVRSESTVNPLPNFLDSATNHSLQPSLENSFGSKTPRIRSRVNLELEDDNKAYNESSTCTTARATHEDSNYAVDCSDGRDGSVIRQTQRLS